MKTVNYRSIYRLDDSEYELIEEIGHGEFGTVYKARRTKKDRQSGIVLYSDLGALKIIEICNKNKFNAQKSQYGYNEDLIWQYFINREKSSLMEVRNQKKVLQEDGTYVVNIKECDIYINREEYIIYLFIFMESLTPLTKILEKKYLNEDEIYKLGKQIAMALVVCHKNGIYHRDIKASNIFITDHKGFKLGDFGISKMMSEGTYAKTKSGTPWYMAPEISLGNGKYPYNESIDIYSLGILLYYLFNNGRYPFLPLTGTYGEEELEEAFFRKNNYDRPENPVNAPPVFAEVIQQMIREPEKRIANAEIFLKKWENAKSELENSREMEKKADNQNFSRKYTETLAAENVVQDTLQYRCKNHGTTIPNESHIPEIVSLHVDDKISEDRKEDNEHFDIAEARNIRLSVIITVLCVIILTGGLVIACAYLRNQGEIGRFLKGNNGTSSVLGESSGEKSMSESNGKYSASVDTESADTESADVSQVELESTVEFIYEDNVLVEYRGKSKEIYLPDGLKGIGDNAFADNLKVSHVVMPDGVEFIGNAAFKNCISLSEIEFSNTIELIGENAFSKCEKLQNIVLPEALIEIKDYAFLGCSGLKTVTFSEKLQSIGKMAFISCTSLEKVKLGSAVKIIGDSSFQSCTELKEVVVQAMDCELETNVFASCHKNLIVSCYENSTLHAYAVEHDIQYQLIQ